MRCFLACLLVLAGSARADRLVGYDFDTGAGDGEDVSSPEANVQDANVTVSSFTTGIGLNAVYDFTVAPADGLDAEGEAFGTANQFAFGGSGTDFGFEDVNDADDLSGADLENGGTGDGYSNLLEFALGMDPNLPDAGSKESIAIEEEAGTEYFVYEYDRRVNHLAEGLSYTLIQTADLVTPIPDPPHDVVVGAPAGGYETVTTRYPSHDAAKFIQLKVELE